jgi:hypothetical protein
MKPTFVSTLRKKVIERTVKESAYKGTNFDALREYKLRKAGKVRPLGTHGAVGRWFSDGQEKRLCCLKHSIQPSFQYPLSVLQHCLSMEHVAELFDCREGELKSLLYLDQQLGDDLAKYESQILTLMAMRRKLDLKPYTGKALEKALLRLEIQPNLLEETDNETSRIDKVLSASL